MKSLAKTRKWLSPKLNIQYNSSICRLLTSFWWVISETIGTKGRMVTLWSLGCAEGGTAAE